MRLARAVRRLALLAAHLPAVVRLAGGMRAFLQLGTTLLVIGEWRALLGWLAMATNFARREDAKHYRRWLRKQSPAEAPDGDVLVLVARDLLPKASQLPLAALPNVHLVGVDDASADGMVQAMRERLLGDSSARWRYVALCEGGSVPGDLPLAMPSGADGTKVLFYGDEDWLDERGLRTRPFFKPAFSPDLLLHADYLSNCLAMTTALAHALPEEPVLDFHSLALALVECADEVRHVDAFLAHRVLSTKTVRVPSRLGQFLETHYGDRARVEERDEGWVCRYGRAATLVTVVIPTRDRLDLLRPCVESIYGTNACAFEVLVVDNGSTDPATLAWLEEAATRYQRFHVVPAPGEFNWSALNNVGIAHAQGDVLVFLNNDTEALQDDWLTHLADVALRPDVGAVGTLLLYPNGRIQHAGTVIGLTGLAAHVYAGVDPETTGHPFVAPTLPRNVSAVTGACLAVARDRIETFGAFDEGYRVSGGDVEFCLRAIEAGYVNVYLPDVRLRHHESQSRKRVDPEEDVARLRALLDASYPKDPYYNAALSLRSLYPFYGD